MIKKMSLFAAASILTFSSISYAAPVQLDDHSTRIHGAPVTIFTSDGVVAPSNVDISDVEKAVEAYKRKEQNRYSDDRKDSDLENRLRALEQENDKLSRELDDLKRKIK
ncbi:hypothetical protein [Cronobacter sakazakii]|uniref:hypothetical protein n=2 Tax=Cronobacter sakazakii TaxID=28141 RepID=UPI0006D0E676|nr:hypothetical protein [Cronobacter sakazakii]AZP31629.1 hypothetical protein DC438_00125 [Cronobacter sakazakii]EKK3985527.1 hypothetical protein [Cronobacter sakazakii]ELQ6018135.1 hypothetical protein [Cronobacter sakazakii]ELQ6065232.1 hypothetical protein [Cronobacter sakazakii]ELQ6143405.1 hypothetical protein [Cronobacter sakazakii]